MPISTTSKYPEYATIIETVAWMLVVLAVVGVISLVATWIKRWRTRHKVGKRFAKMQTFYDPQSGQTMIIWDDLQSDDATHEKTLELLRRWREKDPHEPYTGSDG